MYLKKHQGVINYENDTLTLIGKNNVSLPLQFYNYNFSISIAPRCEVIKYNPVKVNYDCFVMSKILQEAVYLASVVATPKGGNIPIRIINTTDENVNLN